MASENGIVICGHGSRDGDARRQFGTLVDAMRKKLAGKDVEFGYLEFARPTIGEAIDTLRRKGKRVIRAVPAMLFAAGHVKNDIPALLREHNERHSDMDIVCGREMGFDLKLIRAASERIRQTLDAHGIEDPSQCALLVVGRGASDPDANANVCKVMRLLWEGMGFGWGETAYSGVTFPLTTPALERIVRLGYRQVVVFPYFLFTGVLIKRIEQSVAEAAKRYRDVTFINAPYLGSHPLVVDTLIERIDEIDQGMNAMNCRMCKYRAPMVGFEEEVALPQHSHHHHVEGILDAPADSTPHQHHHGHHPYPHADHPLGPLSLKKS